MIKRDVDLYKWLVENKVVEPVFDRKVRKNRYGKRVISYGLSEAGVDVRCGGIVRMIKPLRWWEKLIRRMRTIDPKNIDMKDWITVHFKGHFDIPPRTSVLVATLEVFKLPHDVIAIAIGKSTYARCFLVPIMTPLEPGWGLPHGSNLTIEIVNPTDHKIRIYEGEGIAQIIFFDLSGPVARPYSGYYNDQGAIPVLAHV